MARQLKAELTRIQSAPLSPAQRWYVYSLFTRVVQTVSSASPEAGQRAVDGLREEIDRALSPPSGGR